MSTSAIICAWAGGACLGIASASLLATGCPTTPAVQVTQQRVQTPMERCLARCSNGACQRRCALTVS